MGVWGKRSAGASLPPTPRSKSNQTHPQVWSDRIIKKRKAPNKHAFCPPGKHAPLLHKKSFFSENPVNAFEFTAKEVILTVKTNIQYQTGR
jgi:hypothetical protein